MVVEGIMAGSLFINQVPFSTSLNSSSASKPAENTHPFTYKSESTAL